MLWYSLSLIVATGAIVPFQWVSPRAEDYGIFILFAAAGTVGQYLMTQAFRYGEASLLAPIDYSALIWATLLGFLFWQEFPTPTVFAGAAIIVASSLYILHRETRMARRPLEPAATAAHLPEA
jgi:drug/metabolite transporter (DMT)-like permease